MPTELVPLETIHQRIFFIRGKRVMLDADLARFYGVATGHLNRAVLRNADRFPEDFAFKLIRSEALALKCQSGISKAGRGGSRRLPTAFTEQGVAMLASVLRTQRAALVSVAIVRAFVHLRELLAGNQKLAVKLADLERKLGHHDAAIREIFETIRQLLAPPASKVKREMGFHARLLSKVKSH
jgi:hypothetical protein